MVDEMLRMVHEADPAHSTIKYKWSYSVGNRYKAPYKSSIPLSHRIVLYRLLHIETNVN